nr:immunoglobulin heavy chain junction region [Macaca mulatta]MOX37740.1 immunoglobulin heavy chain junction region [Macaca mulatta]MOX37792.1 immunoglobulin heavy chain junction region [Macaca mulatta]MOX37801.1 immunoglobulin heavy chain junction region [Macaca mulatta]MOX37836.1 immunoglobulin heavy chain junction region [Macaca mulatta]
CARHFLDYGSTLGDAFDFW